MIVAKPNESLVQGYWNSIKNAPSEIKLKLISLLTESLVDVLSDNENINDKKSLSLLHEVCGSWEGPESAEELIEIIREKRTSRPPLSL
ncbi:MAG: hypothetical protein J1F38_10345 [Muribaculaceae bacterium]|nr:hypothetical protein [Muribaculaceae bacterium]